MFSLETPSRVLRRIQDLEEQEHDLPSLPDFPSFEDDDSNEITVAESTRNLHHSLSPPPPPPLPSYSSTLNNITNNNNNKPLSQNNNNRKGKAKFIPPPALPTPQQQQLPELPSSSSSSSSSASLSPPHSPVRETTTVTTLSTPSFLSDATTATAGRATSTNPTSHNRFLETPLAERTDAERRKEHLLMTLRSTAKPRLAAGTPHPAVRRISGGGLSVGGGSPEADDRSYSSDGASSNDLTTHHAKANTSLPSGGLEDTKSARFNGAKLNSYLHTLNTNLTEENQSLAKELTTTSKEVKRLKRETQRLEEQVREMSVIGSSRGGSGSGSGEEEDEDGTTTRNDDLVLQLQREISELKNQADQERNSKSDELEELRKELKREKDVTARETEALNARADELLVELEARDGELERARAETEEQSAEFADKMGKLEDELCRVMEEQEAQLENARADLVERRKEDEELRKEKDEKLDSVQKKCEELDQKLKRITEERDSLERQMESQGTAVDKEETEQSRQLRQEVANLTSLIKERDSELSSLQSSLSELTSSKLESDHQLSLQLDNLRQVEEALDESSRQLIQNEDELSELRSSLARERTVIASLSSQISQFSLHKTKAKSPLANEVSISGDTSVVASLEEELDQAHKEIGELQERVEKAEAVKLAVEAKDLEIRTLKAQKRELEDRVKDLRDQQSSTTSAAQTPLRKTPDKSVMFKAIVGLKTPKTPGQFASNLPNWSPGSAGDATISPLLAQIHELELMVQRLQHQLSEANQEIDNKLDKLEASGSGAISLSQQLALARERIAQLEGELDRLVGDNGSLLRVRKRLGKMSCPECQHTFDANGVAQLKFEKMSRGLGSVGSRGLRSPRLNESLRDALAGVNSKVTERRAESTGDIHSDNENILRQHSALQKDFAQARVEIAGLETELRTERNRLRTLANEQTLTNRSKAALESRLVTAEAELRQVKQELAVAGGSDAQDRLRREKSNIVGTRDELLQQLAELNQRASQNDSELLRSRTSQADMQAQLDLQILEIDALRKSLQTKEAAHRLLQDERGDILRGVAGLQADLQRVRQDAISLGLDLANVRRERDAIGAKRIDGDAAELRGLREELVEVRRKLRLREDHVCSSESSTALDVKARHAQEARGLLVQIRYLKQRVTREAMFRHDLSYQKAYLGLIVKQKQSSIDATLSTLAQLGLPRPPSPRHQKLTFKAAARAVMAIARMRTLKNQWQEQSLPKMILRNQAYPDVRGRPFVDRA